MKTTLRLSLSSMGRFGSSHAASGMSLIGQTRLSKIKVVQILHTLLTIVIFINFFSKRVLKISQQLNAY